MADRMSYISLALFTVLVFWDGVAAQSGCTTALVGLYPCVNYVTGNSSSPSSSCCSQLSGVVQSQPQCLCALLNGGASNFGIAINQTLALALPAACKVQTPPVSQCNAGNGPSTSAPAPSAFSSADAPSDDAPVDPSTSTEPEIPSGHNKLSGIGTGSRTVPATDGGSVGGSNAGASFSFFGVILLISSSWAFSGTGF